MCGIAGVAWSSKAEPVPHVVLEQMTDCVRHRGPDDAGYYLSSADRPAGAALGHRRLSIIDLAGGHQPLSNEDGRVWIAFNGEIYNYRELQADLESRGHRFRTASDTEAIVHAWEEFGTACVDRLRGMFALAIWDERTETLFLARDRLGKKPLVYRHVNGRLWFASELKSLLQVPGAAREIDPIAVDEYLLYKYVPHPRTILKGYAKLPPGHWATFRHGEFRVERYWRPGYQEPVCDARTRGSRDALRRELREVLTEAVRLRLRSDVPLGAFLSGGIDSTIIAGLMQSLSTRPVKTFSIGFPVKQFDERSYARAAAAHLNTEHHEQVVEPAALRVLPRLIWQYDEPFSDSSAIPTLYLSEMTRQHVTVALSGDGGDELFGGYQRYLAVQLAGVIDRLPVPVRKLLGARFWQRIPASATQRSLWRRAKRWLDGIRETPERRYLRWLSTFDGPARQDLYTPEFAAEIGSHDAADFVLGAYGECPERDFVTRTTCVDVLTYLPGDILHKVDIASMAVALEVRCPFLDQEVAEFAARLPIGMKIRGGRGKQILVETFRDLLPESIQKRGKMGFGVPLAHWFRRELRSLLQDVLLDERSLSRGIFRREAVERYIREHLNESFDHSYRLWSLLVFELWQQTFLDAPLSPGGPIALAGTHASGEVVG